MLKFKNTIFVLFAILLLLTVTGGCATSENPVNNSSLPDIASQTDISTPEKTSESDTSETQTSVGSRLNSGVVSAKDYTSEEKDIIQKKHNELDELEAKEIWKGRYIRKRYEIDQNTTFERRITLAEVKSIIKKYESIDKESAYEKIIEEMNAIHKYPDMSSGSGIEILEYWLDDKEKEEIDIWLGNILYVRGDDFDNREALFSRYDVSDKEPSTPKSTN